MKMIYIDHYDSFTYNVIDWLVGSRHELELEILPYDCLPELAKQCDALRPIILSPGPGHPKELYQTIELVRKSIGRVPILGICLGHQILGCVAGMTTIRSAYPLHGGIKPIKICCKNGIFAGLEDKIVGASYHSLVVRESMPSAGWQISLKCHKGEVQGLEYLAESLVTAVGVQFHPESFLSKGCDIIRDRWMEIAFAWWQRSQKRLGKVVDDGIFESTGTSCTIANW